MKIYLYKEYSDDLVYGEEYIKPFSKKEDAKKLLRKRVREQYNCEFEELPTVADLTTELSEEYVAIDKGNGCIEYYIVETSELDEDVEDKPMDVERAKDLFRCYVCNDLEAADTDYVREVLYDICGMSNEELEECGLGGLVCDR